MAKSMLWAGVVMAGLEGVAFAAAKDECKVVGHWAAMVTVYCPAKTAPSDLGSWLGGIKAEYLKAPGRQVHFHVFSDEKRVPKDSKQFFALSDDDYDKLAIGRADFNENTGVKSFDCKRSPGDKQLRSCNDLLP